MYGSVSRKKKRRKNENTVFCDILLRRNSYRRFYRLRSGTNTSIQTYFTICFNVWFGFKKYTKRKKERTIF
jgi:hypothetical protein